jgi:hypothetical protein
MNEIAVPDERVEPSPHALIWTCLDSPKQHFVRAMEKPDEIRIDKREQAVSSVIRQKGS